MNPSIATAILGNVEAVAITKRVSTIGDRTEAVGSSAMQAMLLIARSATATVVVACFHD